MQGKRGLIMGVANDHSIAWGIARTMHAHGAGLAFTYQGEAFAKRVRPLAEMLDASLVVPCNVAQPKSCLLYTSPSPRDGLLSRMPSSA